MKQVYNDFATEFNETRKNLWPELLEFRKFLKNGQRILDLGCGNGRLINLLKDYEIEYVGSDISESLLNYAKKQDFGKITHVDFLEGDMLELDFEKSYFDIIFLVASFHHIKTSRQRVELLNKLKSCLRPGGLIIMTNWNLWGKQNFKKYFRYLLDFTHIKTFRDFIIPFKNSSGVVMGKRFYHAFTISELYKLAKKSKYEIIKNELSKDQRNIFTYLKKTIL